MDNAVDRAREAVLTLTAKHGPEHAEVFAAHVCFLSATADAGLRHTLVASSGELFNQARQALGPSHPSTLSLGFEHAEALGAVSRDLESLELHRQIHGLRVRVLGPDHEESLVSIDSIAARYRGLSDGPSALSMYNELYSARCRISGPDSRDALVARNGIGMALALLARHTAAVEVYEELLPTAEGVFDADSSILWSFRNNYANALGATGRSAESAALHRRVYAERLRNDGPGKVLTLRSASNLCTQLRELGDYAEAMHILSQSIDGATSLMGPRHPQMIHAKLELAGLLWISGAQQESMTLHVRITEECVEEFGFAHPTTLFCHESRAERLVQTGDIPAATALRRRIHAAAMEAFGDEQLMRFWAHQILASGLSWAKEHEEGLGFAQLAAEGRSRLLGKDHQGTLDSETLVAQTLVWLKRHREASVKYDDVADRVARKLGKSDRTVLKHRWNAARQLFRAGDQEAALPAMRDVLLAQITAFGEHDDDSLQMLYRFSNSVYETGDWEAALEHLACWVRRVESSFGASAQQTIGAFTRWAERSEDLDVSDQALRARRRLVEAWCLATGPDSDEAVDAETALIAAYMMFDDTEAAIGEAGKFAEGRRRRLGNSHEKALESEAVLADLLELQGDWEALIVLRREALGRALLESSDGEVTQQQSALADALAAAGQDEEALARFGLLLSVQMSTLGPRHSKTARTRQATARLCARSDRPGDAISHYEALVVAQQTADGSDTPESLESRMELAHLLDALGRAVEAADAFRANYALALQLVADDSRVLATRNDLARSLHEEGDLEEAFRLLRWNVIESVRMLGLDHSDTIGIRYSLATALLDAGQAPEAAEILEAAADDHAASGGGLATVLPMLRTLAEALRQSGRSTEVPSAYRRVIAALAGHYPLPGDLTESELREILPDPFRYEDAIELQRLNVAEVHSTYGHRHVATRAAIDELLKTLQAALAALSRE